ncbi:flagellar basal body-associated FliL family protein [Limnohabitans sp. Rim8]|uniref:flagellar basal body-associated FliL family protein n=1 Tax=Limnohabitans sp. Rim8 TaxID=1100718 RepID=UPI00262A42D3|nr:flagellar basal body-associated FliL family protein [Limnohabitans sp. Rim8]
MADEEIEVEGKKKSPLIKIIVIALVAILLLVGTVVGTLFVTGFFDKKDTVAAEEALKNLESGAANKAGASAADAAPQKVAKESPELQRFENSYMELEKPLVSNLTNTRKVIQLNLAIMTHYDERVFKNAKKHEFALRSVALDVMRQMTEADLAKPEFRKDLAAKIREEMNGILQKYEDFGGIEEVYFTSFVVQ